MFKLDDAFLEEIGLGGLPPEERRAMLKHIYETLEMRVGMKLAQQMSNEQLDEFERFVNGDTAYAQQYLDNRRPGWQQSQAYLQALETARQQAARVNRPVNEKAVMAEFGALSWLETNFPDYKKVVAAELDTLKQEIKGSAQQILAASQQQPPAAAQ